MLRWGFGMGMWIWRGGIRGVVGLGEFRGTLF